MIFTLRELFDVIIMTLAVGYIFMDLFKQSHKTAKQAFWFSCAVTAPALIFHELAHKLVALSFGMQAEFHAAYIWLVIGVALKLMRFGFVFFVPAYVSFIAVNLDPLHGALIAFSGPFLNLILFFGAWLLLKQKKLKTQTYMFLQVTKQINLFLFIFNMLPVPFFDGMKVYQGLFGAFF